MKKIPENAQYFGEREELAVIEYINTDVAEEKNWIYNNILIEPFRIMCETILRRYPIFIGNYTLEELERDALVHLIDKMIIYDPNRITPSGNKTKAYSYCQTIIRNYYRDRGKKNYSEVKVNVIYDDFATEINNSVEFSYEISDNSPNHLDVLINNVIKNIEDKIDNDPTMKKNEIIVGDAIANILKNWQVLFQEDSEFGKYNKKLTNKFAKNKILFFLKEQTGLSTKEIRIAIKPFKEIYYIEKMGCFDE